MNKALSKTKGIHQKATGNQSPDKFIFIKSDKKVYKIDFENILYIEATGDYVKLVTTDNQYLINNTLKNLLEELPGPEFIRVHKSYIISRSKIKFVEGSYIKIGNADVPIGAATPS